MRRPPPARAADARSTSQVSLLLPLLVVLAAAVSGVLAVVAARGETTWLIAIVTACVLSVAGPVVLLFVLRDSPDAFVVSSTVLGALVPLSALAYTFMRGPRAVP